MIRGLIALFASVLFVSACASGKAVKTAMQYPPVDLQITDINVDVLPHVSNGSKLRHLMRNAATNIALAYNDNVRPTAPEYVMEVSVQNYGKSEAQANLRYRVVLRDPDNGMEYRVIPVSYGKAEGAAVSASNAAESLIEGSLPEAFQRLYGYAKTPRNVAALTNRGNLFVDPITASASIPTPKPVSSQSSYSTTTSEPVAAGEPTVVTCAVC